MHVYVHVTVSVCSVRLCSVQGVLYKVYSTWCTVHGVLYMVYCTRCTVHGVLYKMWFTSQSLSTRG